jgi:hypothetical protein
MGLDVLLCAENQENLFPKDYHVHANPELKHSLSRSFCNLMFRQHAIERGEPELDQIGRIASVDIQPLYDMETYKRDDDEEMEFHLSMAKTREEKQRVLDEAKQNREKLKGNVETVLKTINALIEKLSHIDNLNKILDTNDHEMLGHDEYFTDFNTDKGDGYLHNNFGQDLRNFKRFLEYANDKGATTVYFQYG